MLPIVESYLYVNPIYIQSSQASMPQLKKVALAMGNRLAYADTYEEALSLLIQQVGGSGAPVQVQPTAASQTTAAVTLAAPAPSNAAIETLTQVRDHLRRYRELSAQGKWSDAGKELDAIQSLTQK